MWLCDHSDDNDECFPSIETIADEAGVDRKTVFKYIKMLEDLGFLEVKTRYNKSGRSSNYTELYQ